MIWWLVIIGGIGIAMAYAYWLHGSESRKLAQPLAELAQATGGQLRAASLVALPQLRFERNGRRYLVTAMASDGAEGPNAGPFTVVDLVLPFDTRQTLRVERSDKSLAGSAQRLVDSLTPGGGLQTGQRDFDEAFRITGRDQAVADKLLHPDLRHRLLNAGLPRVDVRLEGDRISVHMEGIAGTRDEIEALVAIAELLAERC